MTGKPTKSTSKPARTKSSGGKLSKDDEFYELGREVERLEKLFNTPTLHFQNKFSALVIGELGPLDERQAATIQIVAKQHHEEQKEVAVSQIRKWVERDQTEPIPAKCVGRALSDLGAIDDGHAKSRVEVFAFFHAGLARSVLPIAGTGGVDYHKVAYECTLPRGAKKDVNEINKASRRLEKPIQRLEALRLADARLEAKTSKRIASYLRSIGCAVFNRWPPWPGEASGGPAP